jgi:8-oxo-dGTP pyrophosphatase MutT (NUDIX family)
MAARTTSASHPAVGLLIGVSRMAKTKEKPGGRGSARPARLRKREKATDRPGTVPIALLADMMKAPIPLPASATGKPLLESGVLAYRRRRKSGEPLILMISKRRSKKWGIPKGKIDPYLNFGEAAAKEAFEEAGLIGQVSPHSIGVFRMRKRSATNPQVQRLVEVWIYLLEVTETLTNWPEKGKRQIKWVSCEAAARHLREPLLAQLCHRLAKS